MTDLDTINREFQEVASYQQDCRLCRDTGYVSCYHPLLVRCIREGKNQLSGFITRDSGERRWLVFKKLNQAGHYRRDQMAIPCKCPHGDKHATRMVRRGNGWEEIPIPRFGTRSTMVRCLDVKKEYIDRELLDQDIKKHIIDSAPAPEENDFNTALKSL